MTKKISILLTIIVMFNIHILADKPGWELDIEGGWVANTFNEVAIPGDTGTRFSLVDDLAVNSKIYYRLRLTAFLGKRHQISALFAPLELKASGTLPQDIVFTDETFTAGSQVDGIYRFNSYRLTYRYQLIRSQKISLSLGLTAKVRDAEIALSSPSQSASKTDLGFVPLTNLLFDWHISTKLTLHLEADAAAAKQGRAEDVLLGIKYHLSPSISFKLGYRFVEGGADVDEVYSFAFIHYLAAGVAIKF